MVPFKVLFAYSEKWLVRMLVLGMIMECMAGAMIPLMFYFYTASIESLTTACLDNAGLAEKNLKVIYNVLCVGGGSLVTKLFATILVGTHKARAAAEWRKAYMRAILLQDVGWYDISNSQTLSTAFGEALTNVEAGLGSQVWGQGPFNIGNIVAGFAIGLSSEWATAALAIVFVPYSLYGIWLMGKTQKTSARLIAKVYTKSGAVASEALSSFKTVAYLGIEGVMGGRYEVGLNEAMAAGTGTRVRFGLATGISLSAAPLQIAICSIFGAWLIAQERESSSFDSAAGTLHYCAAECSADTFNRYDIRFLDQFLPWTLLDGSPASRPYQPPSTSCSARGLRPWRMSCFTAALVDCPTYEAVYEKIGVSASDYFGSALWMQPSIDSFVDDYLEANESSYNCSLSAAKVIITILVLKHGARNTVLLIWCKVRKVI